MATKFQTRHYIALANVLCTAYEAAGREPYTEGAQTRGIERVHAELVSVFTRDSGRFDRQKFESYIQKRRDFAGR